MNSPERFLATLNYTPVDHIPYLEEGIRDEVLAAWYNEGLPKNIGLEKYFNLDSRVEIEPVLDPLPSFDRWPTSIPQLGKFRLHLNENNQSRIPENWDQILKTSKDHKQIMILRVHHGFFLSLGVDDWRRFYEVIYLTRDDPRLIHAMLEIQGEFAAKMADKILRKVRVEAALFSEPIAGNHGPLISPRMYTEFILPSFQALFQVLEKHGIKWLIVRTYANPRALLPVMVKAGFNCLWAVECPDMAMDYRQIRVEFGRDLRLIGGIDLDILRHGKDAIQREIMTKIPPLLESGGYIPLLDGRVREGISFENYLYYRQLLQSVSSQME